MWLAAEDGPAPSPIVGSVHLLPYFDAYTVAGQPRELLFPGRAAERALARGQAGNFPVLLVGSDWWEGLVDWVRERLLETGKIGPDDLDLMRTTDDPLEVVEAIAAGAARRISRSTNGRMPPLR